MKEPAIPHVYKVPLATKNINSDSRDVTPGMCSAICEREERTMQNKSKADLSLHTAAV